MDSKFGGNNPQRTFEKALCGACSCSTALCTVACQDIPICGCDASSTATAQSHSLQFGRVWAAAGAGALERLFENRTEGDEWIRAGCVAAVTLAASKQHHLGVALVDGVCDGLDEVMPHTSLWVGVTQMWIFDFVAAGRLDQAQKRTAYKHQQQAGVCTYTHC